MKCLKITKAIPTGEVITAGADSSIIELKIPSTGETLTGKVCKIDPLITQELMMKVEKIKDEIERIKNLIHENILQIKGVCLLPDRILPVLLMDRMITSLRSYFLQSPFPISVKERIVFLQDTASGLNYLHSLNPPFIHGHLTTENVLLDKGLKAKIGGFAIECTAQRCLDQKYMPPEAKEGGKEPHSSLDIFSFGNLALCTILLEEIGPLLLAQEPGEPSIKREVDRRARFMEKARNLLATEHDAVLDIIQGCLQNNPEDRPSIYHVLKILQKASKFSTVASFCKHCICFCVSDDKATNPGAAETLQPGLQTGIVHV